MADITMCSGKGCNRSLSCYRHTAPVSEYRQSMFVAPPVKDGECKYFWDNGGHKNVKRGTTLPEETSGA